MYWHTSCNIETPCTDRRALPTGAHYPRQLIDSKQQVDDFVGELTYLKPFSSLIVWDNRRPLPRGAHYPRALGVAGFQGSVIPMCSNCRDYNPTNQATAASGGTLSPRVKDDWNLSTGGFRKSTPPQKRQLNMIVHNKSTIS